MSGLFKTKGFVRVMILCGQSNRVWHYWAGRHPGSVGLLISPSYRERVPIDPWMPFVIDNDAFTCFMHGVEWSESKWIECLKAIRMTGFTPLWCVVPDVVGDRTETIKRWSKYSDVVKSYGWKTAFAAQDGMTPDDVPSDADVVFIGGTDRWKKPVALPMFTAAFDRVHCARITSEQDILACERLGCESIDGTGWFREPSRADHIPMLKRYIEGQRTKQIEMKL